MLRILASGAIAAMLTLGATTLAPAGAAAAPSASLPGEAKSAASSDIVEVRDRGRRSRSDRRYRSERYYRGDRYYRGSPRWRRYDRRYGGPYYDPYYYDDWRGPACIIVGPLVVCP